MKNLRRLRKIITLFIVASLCSAPALLFATETLRSRASERTIISAEIERELQESNQARIANPREASVERSVISDEVLKKAILSIPFLDGLKLDVGAGDSLNGVIEKIRKSLDLLPDTSHKKTIVNEVLQFAVNDFKTVLPEYEIGEILDIRFLRDSVVLVSTTKGKYIFKKMHDIKKNGEYEFAITDLLRSRGFLAQRIVLTAQGKLTIIVNNNTYTLYEYLDAKELELTYNKMNTDTVESAGQLCANFHAITWGFSPNGPNRVMDLIIAEQLIDIEDFSKIEKYLKDIKDFWEEKRRNPEYRQFFDQPSFARYFLNNYQRIMQQIKNIKRAFNENGGAKSLPRVAIHGDLLLPANMLFLGNRAVALFDFEFSKIAARIEDFGTVGVDYLINEGKEGHFANKKEVIEKLLVFYKAYQDALPEGKKLTYQEAVLIKEIYRRRMLGLILWVVNTKEPDKINSSQKVEDDMELMLRASEAIDSLDWGELIDKLGVVNPKIENLARSITHVEIGSRQEYPAAFIYSHELLFKKGVISLLPVIEGSFNRDGKQNVVIFALTRGENVPDVIRNNPNIVIANDTKELVDRIANKNFKEKWYYRIKEAKDGFPEDLKKLAIKEILISENALNVIEEIPEIQQELLRAIKALLQES